MTNQITEAMIDAGAHVLGMATAAHLTGAPRTLAEQVYSAMEAARPTLTSAPEGGLRKAQAIQIIAQVLWEKVGPAITAARAADIARDILAALATETNGIVDDTPVPQERSSGDAFGHGSRASHGINLRCCRRPGFDPYRKERMSMDRKA
jgi:hypothetical protein